MDEYQLISKIKEGNQPAFKLLFDTYFEYLSRVARSMLGSDTQNCEEAVQITFIQFWNKRKNINVSSNLKAYLKKMVINNAIKILKTRNYVEVEENVVTENIVEETVIAKDLYESYNQALNKLPQKCRETFILSRSKGKNYKDCGNARLTYVGSKNSQAEVGQMACDFHQNSQFRVISR